MHLGARDLGKRLDAGEVLRLQAGLFSARPNLDKLNGPTKNGGQGQGRPENLPASLTV
jgi:hypothetical protein